ncbi:SDR family NAD(P)-dependent oxidoreductase [Shewanella yunxiaonensis]|uniref:SDR family NAD(P)-dependent oxidoreductase n=1 Tax=Shewanella yunxiaonensis TaxID=2829809 RepID=A0ABX7YPP9_9GAMM|nr:SDR family NAD(P)-dependent oxidoreductase [Shewanella yunxiaonensis]QUN04734.1 SDR family NAD(P)-dependent oxidoreductase [Shewanella yunxiaonensis]
MSATSAIIVGASSMLSKEIARQLSAEGVALALLAHDAESIREFAEELPAPAKVYDFTIEDPQILIPQLEAVWREMTDVRLILVNTGLNSYHPELPWALEQEIIEVDVRGFAAVCNTAFRLFQKQGVGQIAAINSIAGLRGGPSVAFHAAKAFAQNYLEGLSMHAQRLKLPITITDIQLGLLDKAALQRSRLWLSPVDEVARQVVDALLKGKRRVYVTKRWRLVAWLTKLLPEYIYNTRHWKKKKSKEVSSTEQH